MSNDMNTWIVIVGVYVALTIVTYIYLTANSSEFDLNPVWKRLIVAFLAAWALPILPLELLHNLYYRNRPKKLPKKERTGDCAYKVKDIAHSSPVTIFSFNKEHGTDYSLDDIYGKGYYESLSECLKIRMDEESRGLDVEENLPDDIYTKVAKLFERCRYQKNFTEIDSLIADDVNLILYHNEAICGKQAFYDYWINWAQRAEKNAVVTGTTIKICPYSFNTAIYDNLDGYKPMYTIFRITENTIRDVIFASNPLHALKYGYGDLDKLPYSYDFIIKHTGKKESPLSNGLPCLKCGMKSENMDRYHAKFEDGHFLCEGHVTICPHCNCVTEFCPEDLIPQNNADLEQEEKPTNINPKNNMGVVARLHICSLYFNNPLKNTKYLEKLDKNYLVALQSSCLSEWSYDSLPLQECAAEFNTFLLQDLKKTDAATYENVKSVYIDAINDGVYEAANNLGILLANYEDNLDEGLRMLKLASEHGSSNASANMFALLWGQEYYDQAIDVLYRECNKKTASLQCLWNYAVLSLRSNIPNNTIHIDEEKSHELFERIVNTQNYKDEDGNRVIEISKKCIAWMMDTNEYGRIGQEFHDYLESIQTTNRPKSTYNQEVSKILTGLDFDGDLKMHFAEMRGSGDESWFYVGIDTENTYANRDTLFNHIKAAPSKFNAWCVYLLMTSTTKLPTFWHGGYISREFIFANSDLKQIRALQNCDTSVILCKTSIIPDVQLTGNEAIVTCCYWNDWKGLVKETAKITFSRNNAIEMYSVINADVLYKYDCGILF